MEGLPGQCTRVSEDRRVYATSFPRLRTGYGGYTRSVRSVVCRRGGGAGYKKYLQVAQVHCSRLLLVVDKHGEICQCSKVSAILGRAGEGKGLFVCWLLIVPATCECISGTDLHRQFYVLPH